MSRVGAKSAMVEVGPIFIKQEVLAHVVTEFDIRGFGHLERHVPDQGWFGVTFASGDDAEGIDVLLKARTMDAIHFEEAFGFDRWGIEHVS